MVFGNCGVLQEMSANKGFVEMTGIDAETSQDIAEVTFLSLENCILGGSFDWMHYLWKLSQAITAKNGRYLEAQIQGSKTHAEEGMLVILAAGDRTLFDDCQSCFQAMGKNSFFLGNY